MRFRRYGSERCLCRRCDNYVPHIDCQNLWHLLLQYQVEFGSFANQQLHCSPRLTQVVKQCNAYLRLRGLQEMIYLLGFKLEHS